MPLLRRSLLPLMLLAGPLAAQSPAGWTLTVGVEGLRFAGAAHDTLGPEDAAVTLRPSGRIGGRVELQRHLGRWALGLQLGWAGGEVEAYNEAVAIRDRTADLSRYRVGVGLERHLAAVGVGEIGLALIPALDVWTVDGETRTRGALELALALRLPVGGVALEQRLAVGLSGSPITQADVGEEFELRTLKALVLGVGARVPL